jgi:hypothetical protein
LSLHLFGAQLHITAQTTTFVIVEEKMAQSAVSLNGAVGATAWFVQTLSAMPRNPQLAKTLKVKGVTQ